MNKIWVLGIGPGHKDYILPIVQQKIQEADVIYGYKRALNEINHPKKELLAYPYDKQFEAIDYINTQVAFVVSGDTGFYSLSKMINDFFGKDHVAFYPGISSIQYLCSKLNMSYEDAFLGSVHGRDLDLELLIKKHRKIALLTDKKMTPSEIAKSLCRFDVKGRLHVGSYLSYENETILSYGFSDKVVDTGLDVVVIELE